MASTSLVFDILARDNASRSFQNIGNAAEKAGHQTSGFGTAVGGAMKLAGAALIGGGLISGFKALYNAADESRKIGALTAQVIQTTGGAANVTAEQVGNLAAAIAAKTGIDDEAIQSGQNLLLTFTNVKNVVGDGNDIFNQATQIMTDMSVALGTDAAGSAIQLGKALNDPITGLTALRKVGVSFTEQQQDQIRVLQESGDILGAQKIILQELGREFGGAAEAAATPLDKLQVKVGNLAEDIGGYLIPIVDELATWFGDDLLPAMEGVASAVGDSIGPVFRVLWETLGDVVSIGGDIVGFFNDLPGPIQAGVIALGAIALLKGPVSNALETIALKALYAKDAVVLAGGAAGGLKKIGAGLLGAFGGPVGLAITGVTVGLGFLIPALSGGSEATEAITAATQDYAGALEQANGVITQSVRQAAAKNAQDAGLLDVAEKLGISLPTVTDAITGQGDALEIVRGRLEAAAQAGTFWADANTLAYTDEGQAAKDALDALNALSGQTQTTQADQEQLAAATGELAGVTEEASADAQAAIDEWLKKLQGIAEGFVDPAATYRDMVQELAQTTADQTEDASDSWSDYVGDVDVSLDELAARLDEQLDNQSNWRDNLAHIAQWAGEDVANYLAQMGEDGVDLVAQMADGTTAGAQDMREQILRQIQAGGAEWTANLDNSMKVMAAIGTDGAKKTAAEIANQLGLGAGEVQRIAAQYGINLALGINPVLSALGRPNVHLSGLNGFNTGGGYADGGYTGDGGKYEPKGVVHGGEFVVRKEQTARHRPLLEAINRGAPGYASGGFVSESDVPAPYSTSPYGPPISTAGDAAMDAEYQAARTFIRESGPWGRALSWARSQVGKPYIWGGVGPTGYDCSGFQSAITNVLLGLNPYARRGSTANFPWAGFAAGDGVYTIGSTPNAGGGIGHMAGTLLGVNVESRGGQGVVVGGSARGAHDGLFGTRAHLATFHGGSPYVPRTGNYLLQEGERVIPREMNRIPVGAGARSSASSVNVAFPSGMTIRGRVAFDKSGFATIVGEVVDQQLGQLSDDIGYSS